MASNASQETEIEDVFYLTYRSICRWNSVLFLPWAGSPYVAMLYPQPLQQTPATATLLHKGFSLEELMKTVCSSNQTQRNWR